MKIEQLNPDAGSTIEAFNKGGEDSDIAAHRFGQDPFAFFVTALVGSLRADGKSMFGEKFGACAIGKVLQIEQVFGQGDGNRAEGT